jgi:hypothetical protein
LGIHIINYLNLIQNQMINYLIMSEWIIEIRLINSKKIQKIILDNLSTYIIIK